MIPKYLDILLGTLITIACFVMLFVAVEAPAPVIMRLENSPIGVSLFTFRGRYIVDLLIALFLFGMGAWGIVMGVFTLALIFGIRFLGVKQPDAFNEIFRQSVRSRRQCRERGWVNKMALGKIERQRYIRRIRSIIFRRRNGQPS